MPPNKSDAVNCVIKGGSVFDGRLCVNGSNLIEGEAAMASGQPEEAGGKA